MTQSDIGIVELLRSLAERAEPLPWVWEQCGEKEDCPVVGVAFDADEKALSGQLPDHGDEIMRWNIASEWGSGIESSAPSANAAFVVEAVNAIPALLDQATQAAAIITEMVEALRLCKGHADNLPSEPEWLGKAAQQIADIAAAAIAKVRGK